MHLRTTFRVFAALVVPLCVAPAAFSCCYALGPPPSPSAAATPAPAPLKTLPNGRYVLCRPNDGKDFDELGSLMVKAFDVDRGSTLIDDEARGVSSEKSLLWPSTVMSAPQNFLWSTLVRRASARQYASQYRSTARRMGRRRQGGRRSSSAVAKYELFLAKDAATGELVGMAEMGVSTMPTEDGAPRKDDGGGSEFRFEDVVRDGKSTSTMTPRCRAASVGVLAVLPARRCDGVGRGLMKLCEDVASVVWEEDALYVAVEPRNRLALRFFESLGYIPCLGSEGRSSTMVSVKVRERLRTEERPHVLLKKTLRPVSKELGDG